MRIARAVFALCLLAVAVRAAEPWSVPDAPFRAVIKLEHAPKFPEAGVLVELPELGLMRADLADVVLADAKGGPQPVAKIWSGRGDRALLLAKELRSGEIYFVYFGGNTVRTTDSWKPKTSLLMETRRLPKDAKFDTWQQMQRTWQSAAEVDGAGFVPSIWQGGNPFGESADFVTHYTGWLQTSGSDDVLLYTLSSDASFVLVNGKFEFAWPGIHAPWANPENVKSKTVSFSPGFTKIDYYHAKSGGGLAGTVLGWKRNDKLETIPPEAWLQPGSTRVVKIESAQGWAVPVAVVQPKTFIGYGGQWFYETAFSLDEKPSAERTVEWQFEDGAVFSVPEFRRVINGTKPQMVTVVFKQGSNELRTVTRFHFSDDVSEASILNSADVARYLACLAQETPARLSQPALTADLMLLKDFGTDAQIAKFAEAWLQRNQKPDDPLWLPAQLARLHALAQSDPAKALDEERKIDPAARKRHARQLDLLELDLLVFYLRSPTAQDLARRIAFQNPNSDAERLADIRTGDLHRLLGNYKQAVAQYQKVQKAVVDETAGRKLPAQDQAYSITIRAILEKDRPRDADDKLREWELRHPMAKFDSDFLLLRGRAMNALGRWKEALAELDSFKKIEPDSPYAIDADFYRAAALGELGKKDEARKIWSAIAANYPKHELAAKCRELSKMQ